MLAEYSLSCRSSFGRGHRRGPDRSRTSDRRMKRERSHADALSAYLGERFPRTQRSGLVAAHLPPPLDQPGSVTLRLGARASSTGSERATCRHIATDHARVYERLFSADDTAYLHAVMQSPSDPAWGSDDPPWRRPSRLDTEPEVRELRKCLGVETAELAEWWHGVNLLGSYEDLYAGDYLVGPPAWDIDAAA